MLSVVGLLDSNSISLDLSIQDELSMSIRTRTVNRVLVDIHGEFHIGLLAPLLIVTRPSLLGIKFKLERSRMLSFEVPISFDLSTLQSASVLDSMLSVILLDEINLTVAYLTLYFEGTDIVGSATRDITISTIQSEVREVHVLFLTTLLVESLPPNFSARSTPIRHLAIIIYYIVLIINSPR